MSFCDYPASPGGTLDKMVYGRQSGLVFGAVFKTVRRLFGALVRSIRTVFRQPARRDIMPE